MSRPVISLQKRSKISLIVDAIRDSNHNGFPIVEHNKNGDQRLLGIITRHTLIVIMKNLHLVPDLDDSANLLARQNTNNDGTM